MANLPFYCHPNSNHYPVTKEFQLSNGGTVVVFYIFYCPYHITSISSSSVEITYKSGTEITSGSQRWYWDNTIIQSTVESHYSTSTSVISFSEIKNIFTENKQILVYRVEYKNTSGRVRFPGIANITFTVEGGISLNIKENNVDYTLQTISSGALATQKQLKTLALHLDRISNDVCSSGRGISISLPNQYDTIYPSALSNSTSTSGIIGKAKALPINGFPNAASLQVPGQYTTISASTYNSIVNAIVP